MRWKTQLGVNNYDIKTSAAAFKISIFFVPKNVKLQPKGFFINLHIFHGFSAVFFSLPSKKVYLTLLFTVFENGQNCLTFKSCAQKSNSKRFELFQKSLIFLFLARKFKNFSGKKIRVFIFARLIEMKFVHFTKIGIFCIFLNTVNFTNLFLSKQCF